MPVIVHDCLLGPPVHQERQSSAAGSKPFPTPSQDPARRVLPTPETVRHPRKTRTKASPSSITRNHGHLPTPQTLPRKRTAPDSDGTSSPEGHTTFSHTSASEEKHVGGSARRRPGLTFAQQMGLAGGSNSRVSRVGVGMGGHKSASHAVDRIAPKAALDANPFVVPSGDDNPFLVSPFEAQKTSPLFAPVAEGKRDTRATTPPRLMQPPADPTSPTDSAARHAALRARQRQAEAKRRREIEAKRKEMMDEDNNPFLLKPGESVQARRSTDDAHQPFVTYVFRGTKRIFANPFIPSTARLPHTELRPEDEDFDDHPCPKPRLLWPTAAMKQRATDVEEVTPSPPSSPLLRTPQTRPRAEVRVDAVAEVEVDETGGSGNKRKGVDIDLQPGRRPKVSRRL